MFENLIKLKDDKLIFLVKNKFNKTYLQKKSKQIILSIDLVQFDQLYFKFFRILEKKFEKRRSERETSARQWAEGPLSSTSSRERSLKFDLKYLN